MPHARLTSCSEEGDGTDKQKVKASDRGLTDFIALEPGTKQLLYLSNQTDHAESGHLTIRTSMLRNHPQMTMHMDLLDAHLYVFARV
jgi:hypothetical protein